MNLLSPLLQTAFLISCNERVDSEVQPDLYVRRSYCTNAHERSVCAHVSVCHGLSGCSRLAPQMLDRECQRLLNCFFSSASGMFWKSRTPVDYKRLHTSLQDFSEEHLFVAAVKASTFLLDGGETPAHRVDTGPAMIYGRSITCHSFLRL